MRRWIGMGMGVAVGVVLAASSAAIAAAPAGLTAGTIAGLDLYPGGIVRTWPWDYTGNQPSLQEQDNITSLQIGTATVLGDGSFWLPCSVPLGSQTLTAYDGTTVVATAQVTVHHTPPLSALQPVHPSDGGTVIEIQPQQGITLSVPGPWHYINPGYLRILFGGKALEIDNSYEFPQVVLPYSAHSGPMTIQYCTYSTTLPITIPPPVISAATAEVTTQSGGAETVTAGQQIEVQGHDFASEQGHAEALLLNGKPLADITSWGSYNIAAVLPPTLRSGTYLLAVRTGAGTSNTVSIRVLSIAAANRAIQTAPSNNVGTAPQTTGATTPSTGTQSTGGSGGGGGVVPGTTVAMNNALHITGASALPVGGSELLSLDPPGSDPAQWFSSDPTIASVDPTTGVVTAHSPGHAEIGAVRDGSGTSVTLTVLPAAGTATKTQSTEQITHAHAGHDGLWATLGGLIVALAALVGLAALRRRRRKKRQA